MNIIKSIKIIFIIIIGLIVLIAVAIPPGYALKIFIGEAKEAIQQERKNGYPNDLKEENEQYKPLIWLAKRVYPQKEYTKKSQVAIQHFKRVEWLSEKVLKNSKSEELLALPYVESVNIDPVNFPMKNLDEFFEDSSNHLLEEDILEVKAQVNNVRKTNEISNVLLDMSIHIKENWRNEREQKETLLNILKILQKKNLRTTEVVYNGSLNLKEVPSKWFMFTNELTNENEDIGKGLAYLSEFNSVKDLDTLDTLYSGVYPGMDFSELIRFDGSKVN